MDTRTREKYRSACTDARCAVCGTSLVEENASREHVFPNAIGGRKKVRSFLCAACNNSVVWLDRIDSGRHSEYAEVKRNRLLGSTRSRKTSRSWLGRLWLGLSRRD